MTDLQLFDPCKNKSKCHVAAPRGSRTGTQGIKGSRYRSQYPDALCFHFVKICEDIVLEKHKYKPINAKLL